VLPPRTSAELLDAEETPGARPLARRLLNRRSLTSFPRPPTVAPMRRVVVVTASVLTITSCLGEPVNVGKDVAPAPSPGVGCTQGPAPGHISFTDPDGRC